VKFKRQIGFVILFAGFLALAAFTGVVGLMRQQAGLKLAQWTVRARFPDVPFISTAQLTDWLADSHREPPVLLDARTEDEFNVSHLPNAVREVPPEAIASGKPIVAYCSIGWRSAEAVRHLVQDGHTNVFNLEGSIFKWASEGRPLEAHGLSVRKVHPYDSKWGRLLPFTLRSDQADVGDEAMARARPLRWATGPILLFLLLWWETLTPFLPMFRNDSRQRTRHGLRNITIALLNSGMTALLFVGLWAATANWAAHNGFGLLNWTGAPPLWHALAAVLALDFWTYWWHRLNHRLPFLWRFHRAHHSDTQMDVTTASRFHIGEILFSNVLRIPLILLLGIHLWEIVLYETALIAVIQFHHANIGLPRRVDQLLRCFIVTPAMHKVHHSRWQPETDSNYSSLLSVWDRVFRSFRLRDDPRTIQFGLDDFAKPEDQTLPGILKTPLDQSPRRQP
jgi:sterol desaturase/sphingolipid hydroxylase (fatty acid hydroxylase superfamily)/rhodanese-related sulfurtransferase